MFRRVVQCAEGGALMAGARLEVREYMPPYENVVPNLTLARAFQRNLEALGLDVLAERPEPGLGSTDFGNVTRRVPAIEAGIADRGAGCAASLGGVRGGRPVGEGARRGAGSRQGAGDDGDRHPDRSVAALGSDGRVRRRPRPTSAPTPECPSARSTVSQKVESAS